MTVWGGILAYEVFYMSGAFLAEGLLLNEGATCFFVVPILFLSVGGLAVITGFALAHRGSLFLFVVFSTFCGLLSGALAILFLLFLVWIVEALELPIPVPVIVIVVVVGIGLLVLLVGKVRPGPNI